MAYAIGVNDYIAKISGGLARTNLYMVTLDFPAGIMSPSDAIKNSYLCKAASLPSSKIGECIAPFMGRRIKLAGDKDFDPWTVTMLTDTDYGARGAFEEWLNLINAHAANTGESNPSAYYRDLRVEQLDRNGEPIYTYWMKSVFPTEVGEVQLAYDSNDTAVEFTVTFSVNYWTSDATDSDSVV